MSGGVAHILLAAKAGDSTQTFLISDLGEWSVAEYPLNLPTTALKTRLLLDVDGHLLTAYAPDAGGVRLRSIESGEESESVGLGGPVALLDGPVHDASFVYWIEQGESELGVYMAEICRARCGDRDGDGFDRCEDDCDDTRGGGENSYPGAPELCDRVDNDCNGAIDDAREPAVVGRSLIADNLGHGRHIVWTGAEYGVVWDDTNNVYFARVDRQGQRIGDIVPITIGRQRQIRPHLAWNGEEYGVVWEDSRGEQDTLLFVSISSDGVPSGESAIPGGRAAATPKVAWAAEISQYGVVWNSGNVNAYFTRLDTAGNPIGPTVSLSDTPEQAYAPEIAWNGQEFAVIWGDSGVRDLYFTRVSVDSVELGPDIRVTNASGISAVPDIDWNGEEYGVVWLDDRNLGEYETYFTRLAPDGTKLVDDILVSDGTSTTWSTITWTGDAYAALYESPNDVRGDFYLRLIEVPGGDMLLGRLHPLTDTGDVHGPVIAWADAEFVAVHGADDGNLHAIHGRVGCDPPCDPTPEQCGNRVDDDCDGEIDEEGLDSPVCVDWVPITGGLFMMGSAGGNPDEQPVHEVAVRSYVLTRTEVTVEQYARCVDAGICAAPETGELCNWDRPDRPRHPVNCLPVSDARQFCDWAGGRLPSEAEWEFAARSRGQVGDYPWGHGAPPDCTLVSMTECGHFGTLPVCSRRLGDSDQGLCDLSGNVWEWVEDCWHATYEGAAGGHLGGRAWTENCDSALHVTRGGSWGSDGFSLRATQRDKVDHAGHGLGFRCAASLVTPCDAGELELPDGLCWIDSDDCAEHDDGVLCEDGDPDTVGDRCVAGECVSGPMDFDGDGFAEDVDCDDRDATSHPGAPETCDERDNNCDGESDEASEITCCDGEMVDPPCNGCPAGVGVPAGWACVPAGTFRMGSPADEPDRDEDEQLHRVNIGRPYLLQTTEVTQAEWTALAGEDPSYFADRTDDHPVDQVDWYTATAFCNLLSARDGLPSCYDDPDDATPYDLVDAAAEKTPSWTNGFDCPGYRLPTEAEWERATRAGNDDARYGPVDTIASTGSGTAPVAQKLPNAWGLYDVFGNLSEWVWDRYAADYNGGDDVTPDPIGPDVGANRGGAELRRRRRRVY